MAFITDYCIIRNNTITLNGHSVLNKEGIGDDFFQQAYDFLKPNYPKFYKMDASAKMGFLASEVILRANASIRENPTRVSVLLASASGCLDTDLRYMETMPVAPSPSLFVYTLPNIVIGEICIRNGFKGENACFIQEKFDPDFFASMTTSFLADDQASGCLAGWVEVLGGHYDVFLYLAENQQRKSGTELTSNNLLSLYRN